MSIKKVSQKYDSTTETLRYYNGLTLFHLLLERKMVTKITLHEVLGRDIILKLFEKLMW